MRALWRFASKGRKLVFSDYGRYIVLFSMLTWPLRAEFTFMIVVVMPVQASTKDEWFGSEMSLLAYV
jgi:hypothetical protein